EQIEGVYRNLGSRRRTGRRPPRSDKTLISADLHMHTSHSYDCATDPAALGKPITIIVGEEVKTTQGEVIGLFLKERIEPGLDMGETIAAIQEQGGLVYMPHPFDRLHTIPDAATLLRHLDQIDILEVYNSRLLFDSFNDDALRFAAKYNL